MKCALIFFFNCNAIYQEKNAQGMNLVFFFLKMSVMFEMKFWDSLVKNVRITNNRNVKAWKFIGFLENFRKSFLFDANLFYHLFGKLRKWFCIFLNCLLIDLFWIFTWNEFWFFNKFDHCNKISNFPIFGSMIICWFIHTHSFLWYDDFWEFLHAK